MTFRPNCAARSQAAIAKLGAMKEGLFRADMARPNGSLRDSGRHCFATRLRIAELV